VSRFSGLTQRASDVATATLVGLAVFSSSLLGSSQFRQSGVISSRLVVEPVETHQRVPRRERAGQAANRWAASPNIKGK